MSDQPTLDLAQTLQVDSTNLLAQDSTGMQAPSATSIPAEDPGAAIGPAVSGTWGARQSSTGWFDSAAVDLDKTLVDVASGDAWDAQQLSAPNGLNAAQFRALDDIAAEGQTDFASNALLFVTNIDGAVRGFSQVPVFGPRPNYYAPDTLKQSVHISDHYPTAGTDTQQDSVDQALNPTTNPIPEGAQPSVDELVALRNPIIISHATAALNGAREISLIAQEVLAPNGDYGFEYFVPASPAAQAATMRTDPALAADLESIDPTQGISIDYPTLSRTPMNLMMAQTTLASISQAFSQASYEFLYQAGQFAEQAGQQLPAQLFDVVAGVESSLRQLGENADTIGKIIVTCCERFVNIEYGTSPISPTYTSPLVMSSMTDPIADVPGTVGTDLGGASFTYSGGVASLTAAGRARLQGWSNNAWTTPSDQSETNFFLAYAAALTEIVGLIDEVHFDLTRSVQIPIGGQTRPVSFTGLGTVSPGHNAPNTGTATANAPTAIPVSAVSGTLYPAQGCWTGLMANSVITLLDQECDSLAQLSASLTTLSDELTKLGIQLRPNPAAVLQKIVTIGFVLVLAVLAIEITEFSPEILAALAPAASEIVSAVGAALTGAEVTEEGGIAAGQALIVGEEIAEFDAIGAVEGGAEASGADGALASAGQQVLQQLLWLPGKALQYGLGPTINAFSSLAAVALDEGVEAAIYGRSYDVSLLSQSWWEYALGLFGGSLLANAAEAVIRGVGAIGRVLNLTVADILPNVAFSPKIRAAILEAVEKGVPFNAAKAPEGVSAAQWWLATARPFSVGLTGASVGASYAFYSVIAELLYLADGDPNVKPDWGTGVPVSMAYWFVFGLVLHGPAGAVLSHTAADYPSLAELAAKAPWVSQVLAGDESPAELAKIFPVASGIQATLKLWLSSVLFANVALTSGKLEWLPVVQGSDWGALTQPTPDYQAITDLIAALPGDNGTPPSAAAQALFDQLALTNPNFLAMIAAQHVAAEAQGVADPMAACIATLQTDANNGDAFTAMWEEALQNPFDAYAQRGSDVAASYEAKAEMMNDIALWSSPDGTNSGLYHGQPIADVLATVNTDDVWNEWVATMRTYAGTDPQLNRAYKWALVCYDNGVDISKTPPAQVLQMVRNVDNLLLHNNWMIATLPQHVVTNSSTLLPISNPTLVDSLIAAA